MTDAATTTPAAASGGEYEFSAAQNAVLSDLASSLRWAGIAWLVFGVVSAVALIATFLAVERQHLSPTVLIGNAIAVVLIVAMGSWNISAARPVTRIVETAGKDISNLMDALSQIQKIYAIQRVAIMIGTLLVVAAVVIDKVEHLF